MLSRRRHIAFGAGRHAIASLTGFTHPRSCLTTYDPDAAKREFHANFRPGGPVVAAASSSRRVSHTGTTLHVTRGKKTKSTVKLSDLPQGAIRLDDGDANNPEGEEAASGAGGPGRVGPPYPTVVLQAKQNMQKFENCVLLTRVGGFYELYFEQAVEYGPMLNLKVAQKKTNAGPVPMAGFPFFQLDRFLKILVQDYNRYVAIAEEFPNSASDRVKSGGLMHDRRVARIITPGTLIDENFMDPYANNYVMAIHVSESFQAAAASPQDGSERVPTTPQPMEAIPLGLAWLDLSTGQFFTQATDLASLSTILSRIGPREVILDRDVQEKRPDHALFSILAEDRHLITYAPAGGGGGGGGSGEEAPPCFDRGIEDWAPMLESELPPAAREAFGEDEVAAGSLLLRYVGDRLQGLAMKLQPPMRYENMHVMTIDKNSLRALEIKQTIRDGLFRGSLLHAVRRTVTRSGARLLNEWLIAPSTSLEVINGRLDLVEKFLEDEELREGIVVQLARSFDSQRLVQKFTLGRGNADDLVALANTIRATESIVRLLALHGGGGGGTSGTSEASGPNISLASIAGRIQLDNGPSQLADSIQDAIDEEGVGHHHELEDREASRMLSLAEAVVSAEGCDGSTADAAAALPKGAMAKHTKKKKAAEAAAAASATATAVTKNKKKNQTPPAAATSIREYYGEDNEAWIMKPDASPTLARLHGELSALTQDKAALETSLRDRLRAPSLTLRWTPSLGHVGHVRGRDATRAQEQLGGRGSAAAGAAATGGGGDDNDGSGSSSGSLLAGVRSLSASRSTRTLHLPEWSRLGRRLDQARLQVRGEEAAVFARLREAVVRSLVRLRRNAAVLDELDVTASFARLAREQGLVRPRVDAGTATKIIAGRHPTVEGGLRDSHQRKEGGEATMGGGGAGGRGSFTPNDCLVGAAPAHARVWLVTGPNMAGKSTFLRQNGLIAILAQAGSYVPAAHAELGVVDAVFSRVGSADNLSGDQSTFMVEMLETAHILRTATPRSFVVMDEIGRGTTPEDGAAVAYAALHHLATVNRCRALFATHFHAVADMAEAAGLCSPQGRSADGQVLSTVGASPATTTNTTTAAAASTTTAPLVEMYCTDVQEDDRGGFVYVHKLRRGVNRRSHALKVARMAGLPEQAIRVAEEVLSTQQHLLQQQVPHTMGSRLQQEGAGTTTGLPRDMPETRNTMEHEG